MKSVHIILITAFASVACMQANAQTTYMVMGGKEEILLNRLEIKTRTNQLAFSSIKPYNRKAVVKDVELYDSLYNAGDKRSKQLTEIDKYNMQRLLMANSEWSKPREIYKSERPLWGLYQNRANMVELREKDFILIANPIIQYEQGSKGGNTQSTFINKRGAVMRGLIGGKVGFHFYFTENQERQPLYVQDYVNKNRAVPGAGYIKSFKVAGYDYFDVRGGLSWKVAKFMDMQLGYDRNFIGNGYRSLLLSDFSTNAMFLKVNTHFGKVQYENLFMELVQFHTKKNDYVYPRKYFRTSHLSINATKWLNIGLFDGVMLAKTDVISLNLFNPVLYTNVESGNDALKDKKFTGFDIKMNLAKKVQVYAQTMVDKLNTSELQNDWWGNRFGYQVGLKYVDAFKIKNLDVQLETNRVRPYTYASNDSATSYTHYNQQLAHPLGANFEEYICIVKYQPVKKIFLEAKAIYYKQGLDSSMSGVNQNYGSNVFAFTNTRPFDNGFSVGRGNAATCTIVTLLASYELRENLFIDLSYLNRQFTSLTTSSTSTSVVSIGVRLNIARRELIF
jgi:hypothetical protein